jgi:hypothetical protein
MDASGLSPQVSVIAMAATVYVNGQISSERDAVVSVFDHGFLYGEGVYETLRTYNAGSSSSIAMPGVYGDPPG